MGGLRNPSQAQRAEQYEQRAHNFKKTWETDLMGTCVEAPGYWCCAFWCSPCASFQLRKRALYGDMNRYLCCGGYLPCSGRCGESSCPSCCLCLEVTICFSNSVAATRWMLQDEMHLSNTKCDNCIIATTICLQYASCILQLLAICISELREAAAIVDCIADSLWCTMCACMQTQHKVQLDARDKNPSLVQRPHPMMAPVHQAMGATYPPPQSVGGAYGAPPPGYPGGPAPGGPPPPAARYPPPPPGKTAY